MPVSAGRASASHRAIQWRTVVHFDHTARMMGRKVRSKHSTWSSAWFAIHATWSGARRGLIVCSTRPLPDTPK
jgi:hypothetical protein